MTACFRKTLTPSVRISCCNNFLLQRCINNIIFQFPVAHVDIDTNIVCLGAASSFLYISHRCEEAVEQTAYLPPPTVFFIENFFVFQHKAETLSVIGFWELQTWTLTGTVQFNYNSKHKEFQTRLCRQNGFAFCTVVRLASRANIHILPFISRYRVWGYSVHSTCCMCWSFNAGLWTQS
jgi:hypothetical protein